MNIFKRVFSLLFSLPDFFGTRNIFSFCKFSQCHDFGTFCYAFVDVLILTYLIWSSFQMEKNLKFRVIFSRFYDVIFQVWFVLIISISSMWKTFPIISFWSVSVWSSQTSTLICSIIADLMVALLAKVNFALNSRSSSSSVPLAYATLWTA